MKPRAPARGYLEAKNHVIAAGYADDIDWASDLENVRPDALYVMRESAWVILNSGFRFQVARRLWPQLTEVFFDWDHVRISQSCLEPGLEVLNHPGKIQAIIDMAGIIRERGHEYIVEAAGDPPSLCQLPWIGRITCWHLAKVLGIDCIKPDVHLQRAAEAAGFESPTALAEAIRDVVGDRLTIIDSVLWRYGEQQKARGWLCWSELW